MLRALVLVVVLTSPLAHADDCDLLDPAPGTGATQIAQGIDNCVDAGSACTEQTMKHLPPQRERHGFIAGGQATVGTLSQAQTDGETLTAGDVAASGRAGWLSGLQACGSTTVIVGTQSRGDTAFHVVFPWPLFETGMLGFEQQWQLRPRLDSSRIWLRRLYSSTEFQAGIGAIVWAHKDGGGAAVLPFRVNSLQRDQDRTGATLETIRVAAYESTRPDSHTEILPVTFTDMYPYEPVVDGVNQLPSSELVRVDAVALTRRRGELSYEFAAGMLSADRPIARPVAGVLGIGWGPWSARVERAAYLAMDDSITIENRVTAGYHDGIWRAGAFAAVTHTSSAPKPQVTGGGSAGVDVDLPEQLKLAVDLEVARSYYARLDGDPTPTPQLAGLGTVRLERHFNVNPTAH